MSIKVNGVMQYSFLHTLQSKEFFQNELHSKWELRA